MRKLILGVIAILVFTCISGCETVGKEAKEGAASQIVDMSVSDSPRGTLDLGFGNCQWLHPFDKPQEVLRSQPQYGSGSPVFYVAEYGDASDNKFTMALDESKGTGTGYDRLYVDMNNDNVLDPEGEQWAIELSGLTVSEENPVRITLQVCTGDYVIPLSFSFTAFRYSDVKNPEKKIHANARNTSYFVGEAEIGGERCAIALADLNSNGIFCDSEQRIFGGDRFFVDLDGDGKFKDSYPYWDESFPYGGYTRIAGEWYTIAARKDGQQVSISAADPRLGKVKGPDKSAQLELRSPTQSQWLDFSTGEAEAIEGEYRPSYAYLRVPGAGDRRPVSGRFKDDAPTISVRKGQVTTLNAGPPLRAEISASIPASPEKKSCMGLDLLITGQGGETYSIREAKFEVRDEHGNVVAFDSFEYG